MSWESQLSSILSVADGSVAKMRENLTQTLPLPRGEVRERIRASDLPAPPPPASLPRQLPPSVSAGVQWADVAAIQSQLQLQCQAIESLTQKLRDMERGRQSQQYHIQSLQEEVDQLREKQRDTERERGQSPGIERLMEQLKREVGRELSSLRGQFLRATTLENQEESFSSKLHRQEVEQLRRDMDQLRQRLRRQEEDVLLQQSEARETRRQYERSCNELTDKYRTHSTDLAKALCQCSHTQQEVHHISTTVSELKQEVKCLMLRERGPTPSLSVHSSGASPLPPPRSRGRGPKVEEAERDSDSEDLSTTLSLAEISSDDLSWLEDKDPAPHRKPPGSRSGQTHDTLLGTDLEDDDDDEEQQEEEDGGYILDDVNADLGSDLSIDDL
ncbi:uncharacterized protein ACBR49_007968 [Aulostomus maculatus]